MIEENPKSQLIKKSPNPYKTGENKQKNSTQFLSPEKYNEGGSIYECIGKKNLLV